MARTKNTNRQGRRAAINAVARSHHSGNPGLQQPLPTPAQQLPETEIEKLLVQVDQLAHHFHLDQAKTLCQQFLSVHPSNLKALERLALIELELGHLKSAEKHFKQIIHFATAASAPHPPSHLILPPSVHLYLAQLSPDPHQSLHHFQAGFDLLKRKLDHIHSLKIRSQSLPSTRTEQHRVGHHLANLEEPKLTITQLARQESQVRRSCSRALVGMTELYLTDLCFDESAEQKCLEYLANAADLDSSDPEPLQTLASVKISQSDIQGAKESLKQASLLWPSQPASASTTPVKDLSDLNEDSDTEGDHSLPPPLDTRIQWAKLAIECDMWSEAIDVLQQCESEDDQEGEVQYLLALAWYFLGQSRDGQDSHSSQMQITLEKGAQVTTGEGLSRAECWMEAKECLDTCLQLRDHLGDISGVDQSMATHVIDMLKEISEVDALAASPPEEHSVESRNNSGNDDEDNDGEWEEASNTDSDQCMDS